MAAVAMPRPSSKSKAAKQRIEVFRSVDASIEALVLTQADVLYFTELGSTLDGESSQHLAHALNKKLQLFIDSLEQSKASISLDSASSTSMMIERVQVDEAEMVDTDGDYYDPLDPPLSATYFIRGDEDHAGSDPDADLRKVQNPQVAVAVVVFL